MTSYVISCVFQEQTKLFCDDVCEDTCYLSTVQNQQRKNKKSMNTKKSCYEIFLVNTVTDNALQEVDIIKKNQCMIYGMVEFHHKTKLALLCLDTGAEINVISEQRLLEIFPEQEMCSSDLISTKSNLK